MSDASHIRSILPGREPLSEENKADWRKTRARSRLAAARKHRGISQQAMAGYVGLSIATYRRLESGENGNPALRYLVNCALVLEVELTALIEDDWLEWAWLSEGSATRPARVPFIRRRDPPRMPPAP